MECLLFLSSEYLLLKFNALSETLLFDSLELSADLIYLEAC